MLQYKAAKKERRGGGGATYYVGVFSVLPPRWCSTLQRTLHNYRFFVSHKKVFYQTMRLALAFALLNVAAGCRNISQAGGQCGGMTQDPCDANICEKGLECFVDPNGPTDVPGTCVVPPPTCVHPVSQEGGRCAGYYQNPCDASVCEKGLECELDLNVPDKPGTCVVPAPCNKVSAVGGQCGGMTQDPCDANICEKGLECFVDPNGPTDVPGTCVVPPPTCVHPVSQEGGRCAGYYQNPCDASVCEKGLECELDLNVPDKPGTCVVPAPCNKVSAVGGQCGGMTQDPCDANICEKGLECFVDPNGPTDVPGTCVVPTPSCVHPVSQEGGRCAGYYQNPCDASVCEKGLECELDLNVPDKPGTCVVPTPSCVHPVSQEGGRCAGYYQNPCDASVCEKGLECELDLNVPDKPGTCVVPAPCNKVSAVGGQCGGMTQDPCDANICEKGLECFVDPNGPTDVPGTCVVPTPTCVHPVSQEGGRCAGYYQNPCDASVCEKGLECELDLNVPDKPGTCVVPTPSCVHPVSQEGGRCAGYYQNPCDASVCEKGLECELDLNVPDKPGTCVVPAPCNKVSTVGGQCGGMTQDPCDANICEKGLECFVDPNGPTDVPGTCVVPTPSCVHPVSQEGGRCAGYYQNPCDASVCEKGLECELDLNVPDKPGTCVVPAPCNKVSAVGGQCGGMTQDPCDANICEKGLECFVDPNGPTDVPGTCVVPTPTCVHPVSQEGGRCAGYYQNPCDASVCEKGLECELDINVPDKPGTCVDPNSCDRCPAGYARCAWWDVFFGYCQRTCTGSRVWCRRV